MRKATVETLSEIQGISRAKAVTILEHLNKRLS
jgi:hypothetical protein